MSIDPRESTENEAWLLFQLNDAPVQTESDGNFNVLAIMDVATGLILGMEFVGVLAEEPSEFESRKLLASAESVAGIRPQRLLVDSQQNIDQLIRMASAMGFEVITNLSAFPRAQLDLGIIVSGIGTENDPRFSTHNGLGNGFCNRLPCVRATTVRFIAKR